MRVWLTLAVFLLATIAQVPLLRIAYAAKITAPALHWKAWRAEPKISIEWPTAPVLCDVIVDGEISEGDAKSLSDQIDAIPGFDDANWFSLFLCLRSNGGDLGEAVKIAEFVLSMKRPSIATIVEDGEVCASACAVIFLAGGEGDPGRHAQPRRFLHPRGRLLFHSSQLDLPKVSDAELLKSLVDRETDPRGLRGKITDLYKDGLRDVQRVIATFQQFIYEREDIRDRWVRPSLFLEMFAQDPGEWICADSVDVVGRWNIQVYGYKPPRFPKQDDFSNLCSNAYHWRADEFAVGADIDLESPRGIDNISELKRPPTGKALAGRTKQNVEFDDRVTMKVQARTEPLLCVVEVHNSKKGVDSQSTLATTFINNNLPSFPQHNAVVSELAPTGFFPAATLLRNLPGVRPAPDASVSGLRPAIKFSEHPHAFMNGCYYKSIPSLDYEACREACAVDAACAAYDHNRLTHVCELKHTLTALRLDPLSTSGTPRPGPEPSWSARAQVMSDFYANFQRTSAYAKRKRIEGRLIDEVKTQSLEQCADKCESDLMCLASESELHIGSDEYRCRRFSEITGIREDPSENVEIDIRLKKQ